MKKKSITLTLILLVLLFGYLMIRYNTSTVANQFVEGKVTGTLQSLPYYDAQAFFVRVTEPGTMILVLEKESGFLLGTALEVSDLIGKTNIRYEKNPGGNQVVYVNITQSDLTANGNILDFKVKVEALFGYGTYYLTILKPGQTVTDQFTSDVACFEVEVKQGDTQDDFLLTWNKVMSDLQGLSTVQVKILKKDTKEQIFSTTDAAGQPAAFPPGKIKWPVLTPGVYQVLVELKGSTGGSGWRVTRPAAINPFNENFLLRNIEQGQTDTFELQFAGDEKFLWLSANRPAGSAEYVTLGITLKDSSGNAIPIQRLSPSNITVVPLSGIAAGKYTLAVSNNRDAVSYSLGVEKATTFESVTVSSYRMKQTMIKDLKIKYEVTFANATNQQMTVKFYNNSAAVANVKIAKFGKNEETLALSPQREQSYSLTFGTQDAKGFYLLGVSDQNVTCDFGYENYKLVTMDRHEDGVGNDQRENAISIARDTMVVGNISSQTDVDYFKFNVAARSSFGVTLKNIPQGKNYDIVLLNSTGTEVASSKRPDNTAENLMCLLEPGDYSVKVYSAAGFSSSYYALQYSLVAYTTGRWYSQRILDNTTNWNVTRLSNLYFSKASNPGYSLAKHIHNWGCVLSSHAMLQKNLGCQTKNQHEDFRTLQTGYLEPDPFVTCMAHNGWPTISAVYSQVYNADFTSSNTPVYISNKKNLEDEFGYTWTEVSLIGLTVEEKARRLTNALASHPEGIIVRISAEANPDSRSDGCHSFVFINSSYSLDTTATADPAADQNAQTSADSTKYYSTLDLERYFTVCETGTAHASKGDNVNFKNALSYSSKGGLPHLVYLQYYVKKN